MHKTEKERHVNSHMNTAKSVKQEVYSNRLCDSLLFGVAQLFSARLKLLSPVIPLVSALLQLLLKRPYRGVHAVTLRFYRRLRLRHKYNTTVLLLCPHVIVTYDVFCIEFKEFTCETCSMLARSRSISCRYCSRSVSISLSCVETSSLSAPLRAVSSLSLCFRTSSCLWRSAAASAKSALAAINSCTQKLNVTRRNDRQPGPLHFVDRGTFIALRFVSINQWLHAKSSRPSFAVLMYNVCGDHHVYCVGISSVVCLSSQLLL